MRAKASSVVCGSSQRSSRISWRDERAVEVEAQAAQHPPREQRRELEVARRERIDARSDRDGIERARRSERRDPRTPARRTRGSSRASALPGRRVGRAASTWQRHTSVPSSSAGTRPSVPGSWSTITSQLPRGRRRRRAGVHVGAPAGVGDRRLGALEPVAQLAGDVLQLRPAEQDPPLHVEPGVGGQAGAASRAGPAPLRRSRRASRAARASRRAGRRRRACAPPPRRRPRAPIPERPRGDVHPLEGRAHARQATRGYWVGDVAGERRRDTPRLRSLRAGRNRGCSRPVGR